MNRKSVVFLAIAVAVMSLGAGCADDVAKSAGEKAAENVGGIDNINLGGGEGVVKVQDTEIDFTVGACIESEGDTTLSSDSSDPAVALTSATNSIVVSQGDQNWISSDADIKVEDGTLTASGTVDDVSSNGVDEEGVTIEVTADCS
jgi:hypothetical protein